MVSKTYSLDRLNGNNGFLINQGAARGVGDINGDGFDGIIVATSLTKNHVIFGSDTVFHNEK